MTLKEQIYRDDAGRQLIHREDSNRRLGKAIISKTTETSWLGSFRAWRNDVYYGQIYKYDRGAPFGGGPYILISITAKSEKALHDWRDYQQIKNDLAGKEWEAIELYPAESRLVDPSNCFFLWCFPPGILANLGFKHRKVVRPRTNGPPQRPFPEDT